MLYFTQSLDYQKYEFAVSTKHRYRFHHWPKTEFRDYNLAEALKKNPNYKFHLTLTME